MLKCAGRGHDPDGASATVSGGLAVDCPACPQPEWNFPEGWKDAPTSIVYVFI